MLEDVSGKINKFLLNALVEDFWLPGDENQNFVVHFSVLNLLHQCDRIAIDDLTGFQVSLRQDETIHVVSVLGAGVEDEPIRKRKST